MYDKPHPQDAREERQRQMLSTRKFDDDCHVLATPATHRDSDHLEVPVPLPPGESPGSDPSEHNREEICRQPMSTAQIAYNAIVRAAKVMKSIKRSGKKKADRTSGKKKADRTSGKKKADRTSSQATIPTKKLPEVEECTEVDTGTETPSSIIPIRRSKVCPMKEYAAVDVDAGVEAPSFSYPTRRVVWKTPAAYELSTYVTAPEREERSSPYEEEPSSARARPIPPMRSY